MSEAGKMDANLLLQEWERGGVPAGEQRERIRALLGMASPLILMQAKQVGQLPEADKQPGIQHLAAMLKEMPEGQREFYVRLVAREAETSLSLLRGQLKASTNGKNGHTAVEDEPERTTGGWINGHLVELLYDPEKMRTSFAVRYPDGRVEAHVEKVSIEGRTYGPIWTNSILTKNGVRVASEVYDAPLSEKELLGIIRGHIAQYFDFGSNDFFEEISPQFVLFSYFADAFMETTYLRALGDYGTGKTRFLKAIGLLCYRPIYVTGGSSAASLYHFLDKYRGTLVLNEADFGQTDEAAIIGKILNGGTERDEGISKMRKDPNGQMEIEMYNVFGPKVIATRHNFDDRAIESRCLTMEMVPLAPHPRIPRHLPPNYGEVCCEIRNLLTTYRLFNARQSITIDESKVDYAIEPRLSQVSGPLLEIITDEAVRNSMQAFLREYNERERGERFQTKTARVMEGLMRAWAWGPASSFPDDAHRIYLKDIASATNAVTDEMNVQMGDDSEEEQANAAAASGSRRRTGGKMTSRGVTNVMKKYLQLGTRRATDGSDAYKGTMFVDMTRDLERVRALCERWGVKYMEPGSVKRPVTVDLNKPDSFAKDREAWKQAGIEGDE
jgi:hypothetical protein